jgi:predicted DNA-binding transcriptional regulator YafY
MPADKRATIDRLAFFAPSFHVDGNVSVIVDTLHRAIDSRHVVSFAYLDKNGAATQRRVWPLALAYWGARFTLGAWCELRGDFRHFALTNIGQLDVLEPFPDVEGRRLADFMRSIGVKAR